MDINEDTLFSMKNKKRELLDIFTKYKNISLYFKHKGNIYRLDLTYLPGTNYGIKFAEVIVLGLVKQISKTFIDDKDDDKFTKEYEKVLSPLDFNKEGKKTIIKDLTIKEIENIVYELNKPID